MRILWFANVDAAELGPAAASAGSGGWIGSLLGVLRGRDDVELFVAAPGRPGAESQQDGNVIVVPLPTPPVPRGPHGVAARWDLWADEPVPVETCVAVTGRVAPDLIHVHGTERSFGLVATRVGVPAVVSIQGVVEAVARVFLQGVSGAELARDVASLRFLKGGGLVHEWAHMRARVPREQAVLRGASAIVGRTDFDRDYARRVAPRVPYYHCDETLRDPFYAATRADPGATQATGTQSADLGGTRPTVLCVSGSDPYKGIDTLLAATALVRNRGLEIELRVAGPVAGSVRWPAFDRMARDLDLDGTVTWLGPLPGGEIAVELERASLAVSPSRMENSPNGLCEAMMVGAPCVARAVGGIPSLVQHDVTGLLVESDDPGALAAGMADLLSRPTKAATLGAAAASVAHERHDRGAIGDRIMAIYASVLERKTPMSAAAIASTAPDEAPV